MTTTLADVDRVFQETLHMPDLAALHVVLATVVANRMEGEPVWLLLIGPPSSAKTETVETLGNLPDVVTLSATTKAGLLSGSSEKGGTGGVLFEGGERFLLVVKDFTTVASEHASTRNEVLAIFREIFDGKVERAVGSGGGKRIKWRGHAGAIACATEAVDAVDMANFGERWVRFRLPDHDEEDRLAAGHAAIANVGHQREQRARRQAVVTGFFESLSIPEYPPALSAEEQAHLVHVADIGTKCRSAVVRGGGHGDEITQVPQPEETPRLVGELGQLAGGLSVIGVDRNERWRILVQCAFDGMGTMRRRVIDVLLAAERDYGTATVAGRCRLPVSTVRRHLQDLNALGLVDLTGTEPETWQAGDWLRRRWSEVVEIPPPAPPALLTPPATRRSLSVPTVDLSDPDTVARGLALLDRDASVLMETRFTNRWPNLRPLHLFRMGWADDVRRWRPEVRQWVGEELAAMEPVR